MSEFYRLNPDHSVTPVTMHAWAIDFEDSARRIVANTEVAHRTTKVQVSTVFLGFKPPV